MGLFTFHTLCRTHVNIVFLLNHFSYGFKILSLLRLVTVLLCAVHNVYTERVHLLKFAAVKQGSAEMPVRYTKIDKFNWRVILQL